MGTTVQAILQEHYEAFAARYPLAPYQRAAAEALRDCRTAALGGHWRSCPNGHVHTAHFNSCHHRSCPQCASLPRQQWLAGWQERLLDCPHAHLVFTTPPELIPLWRYNKRLYTGLLFHAAADAVRELLADPKYLGAVPGLLAGLHTWGQELPLHIHVHLLVTWGGLTADGQWREPIKSCLLPRRVLMAVFRGKLRAALAKALDRGELALPPDRTAAQIRGLLNRVGRLVWNVKLEHVPPPSCRWRKERGPVSRRVGSTGAGGARKGTEKRNPYLRRETSRAAGPLGPAKVAPAEAAADSRACRRCGRMGCTPTANGPCGPWPACSLTSPLRRRVQPRADSREHRVHAFRRPPLQASGACPGCRFLGPIH